MADPKGRGKKAAPHADFKSFPRFRKPGLDSFELRLIGPGVFIEPLLVLL
jgi:hypothetical protein